jgi:hypothetical protein
MRISSAERHDSHSEFNIPGPRPMDTRSTSSQLQVHVPWLAEDAAKLERWCGVYMADVCTELVGQ